MIGPSCPNGCRYLPSLEMDDPVRQDGAYDAEGCKMPQQLLSMCWEFEFPDCSIASLA